MTGELKAAKCDVPDIMVMTMCNRYGSDSATARECAASMPADARALTRTATLASEPPLLCPLPHTAAIARLRQAKRAVPEVRPNHYSPRKISRGLYTSRCIKRAITQMRADPLRRRPVATGVRRLCVQPRATSPWRHQRAPHALLHPPRPRARLHDAAGRGGLPHAGRAAASGHLRRHCVPGWPQDPQHRHCVRQLLCRRAAAPHVVPLHAAARRAGALPLPTAPAARPVGWTHLVGVPASGHTL